MNVRVGELLAVRIKFSLKERRNGCDYCHSNSHRTYFAYGRLQHVYCNKSCMISHQLEQLMQPPEIPK